MNDRRSFSRFGEEAELEANAKPPRGVRWPTSLNGVGSSEDDESLVQLGQLGVQ